MANTTAMTTSFKQEVLSGGHCFNGNVTPTATAASASTSVTNVSSMTGVSVGMTVTGTGQPANQTVARITSGTALTLALATTASVGGALTFSGDIFYVALIGVGATGTYGTGSTNYTNLGTDEVTGTGYTAGTAGTANLLVNVTATTGGNVAWITFNANPSWTSATFSTTGCMIYNSSVRQGGTSGTNTTGGGRACSIHDFGGNQQVSSGTFTILLPSSASNTAILRIA